MSKHNLRLGADWAKGVGSHSASAAICRPERYRSWLGVCLDVPVDRDVVAAIVEDAYRVVAPKRLLVTLDARGSR